MLICVGCHILFDGRSNRKYCSSTCKNKTKNTRRAGYFKSYQIINGKDIRERRKNRYWSNSKVRQYHLDWNQNNYLLNKQQLSLKKALYYSQNKKKIIAHQILYERKRYSSDPTFKITKTLRHRLRKALKAQSANKIIQTIKLLGCTTQELKQHLESKFQVGMTWDNYGYGSDKWNIDHIIPCARFDLTDPEQQKICFHYTNLQPLWQLDNFKKSDK